MKKSGVFQRKIYFVIIQDDIWLCYAEDVESVSIRFAGKLMLPGVFQDGGEIPAHLMLGRKCGYGVETAAAFPSGQIGWIEWSERKHGLADRELESTDLTGTGRFNGENVAEIPHRKQ